MLLTFRLCDGQVFRLLKVAARGKAVDLPNTASVRPFLNLYTLVVLLPEQLIGEEIGTAHTPDLRVFERDRFYPAPAWTPPGSTCVSRIYDVFANPNKRPGSPNRIPLSQTHPEFYHQRYWRLSGEPGAMLMVFLECSRNLISDCDEINHARAIGYILQQNAIWKTKTTINDLVSCPVLDNVSGRNASPKAYTNLNLNVRPLLHESPARACPYHQSLH